MFTGRIRTTANRFFLLLVTLALAACVSVPNVIGDTLAAATTAITHAGLTVGTVTYQSSSTVTAGDVISQSPAGRTILKNPAPVSLVISTGPPTYTIGGTLIGLAPNATVNVLNGPDNAPIAANGSFTLPTGVVSGGTYSVSVGTPSSAQTCAVQNGTGSGTVAAANVTNVVVYCTYNVSDASVQGTYTNVTAFFQNAPPSPPPPWVPLDALVTATFDGMGNVSGMGSVNTGGLIYTGIPTSGTYAVSTTNAIPSLTNNGGGMGGIEGVNGAAFVVTGELSGSPSSISVNVLADTSATTASINGDFTLVNISAQLSSGNMYGYVGTGTLNNGTVAGTYTENMAGTITTGNPASAQWTVANGLVTSVGTAQGAVSADGDLIILADTNKGDDPFINVAVPRGTGVTEATFEGVYSVAEYGGTSIGSTFGKAITLFAYGNGTFFITQTKNSGGTIGTGNDSGTYTVAADGTLTLTDADGIVSTGAISADGNALVLGNITSGESPAIYVGVRQ